MYLLAELFRSETLPCEDEETSTALQKPKSSLVARALKTDGKKDLDFSQ
jgi:hypothetical protein